MADPFAQVKVILEQLEQEQGERFKPQREPEPKAPQTRKEQQRADAQAFLDRLNASCSASISLDAGWLR